MQLLDTKNVGTVTDKSFYDACGSMNLSCFYDDNVMFGIGIPEAINRRIYSDEVPMANTVITNACDLRTYCPPYHHE